jgi:hypothetical protein
MQKVRGVHSPPWLIMALCRWLRSFKSYCTTGSGFQQEIVEKFEERPDRRRLLG